jgi:hypothetical protein
LFPGERRLLLLGTFTFTAAEPSLDKKPDPLYLCCASLEMKILLTYYTPTGYSVRSVLSLL